MHKWLFPIAIALSLTGGAVSAVTMSSVCGDITQTGACAPGATPATPEVFRPVANKPAPERMREETLRSVPDTTYVPLAVTNDELLATLEHRAAYNELSPSQIGRLKSLVKAIDNPLPAPKALAFAKPTIPQGIVDVLNASPLFRDVPQDREHVFVKVNAETGVATVFAKIPCAKVPKGVRAWDYWKAIDGQFDHKLYPETKTADDFTAFLAVFHHLNKDGAAKHVATRGWKSLSRGHDLFVPIMVRPATAVPNIVMWKAAQNAPTA